MRPARTAKKSPAKAGPRIASATYDPATRSVTLTLAQPFAVASGPFYVGVSRGVRDAVGRPVDGDANGRPGGSGAHSGRTFVGRDVTVPLPDSDQMHYAVTGPGTVAVALAGQNPAPTVWLADADATTVLSADATDAAGRPVASPYAVAAVYNPAAATITFGPGLVG